MSNLLPGYTIKFKNESFFMKVLGKILFFNSKFMTHFITTIGHTIYFPSQDFITQNPISSKVITVHENIHIKDSDKYSSPLFKISYLSPQVLALPALLLFLFLHWFIALPIVLFFILPIPAIFRAMWEEKAYTFSIYAYFLLETKYGYTINYDEEIANIVSNFTSANYYFMLPWMKKDHFEIALAQFRAGNRPFYSSDYYQMAEELLDILMKA